MQAKQATAKLFVGQRDSDFSTARVIETFHRWIQTGALGEGLLPIDVANYSHVHQGPGIMLVCHEAYIALEELGGRPGLSFQARRGAIQSAQSAWHAAARQLLIAVELLQDAAAGSIRFGLDEWELGFNDRLHAPNDPTHFAQLQPALEEVGTKLLAAHPTIAKSTNSKGCFRATVTASGDAPSLATVRAALAST